MIYVVKYLFLICYINTIFLRRVLFCYSYNLSHHFSLYNNSKFVLFKRNKKRNKRNKYHNIYYHKGGFHYDNNIGNNNISNPFFLNKFIYHKKKHKLNFFNSPTFSYDDACILKNLFNSYTTEERVKNKNSDKNVKINVMRKKCMLYLTFNRKENDNVINNKNNNNNNNNNYNNYNNNNYNNNKNNNNNNNNYHVDELYLSSIGEPYILLPSTSWGHLSLFYGSHLNRDYYTYQDIIKYIETNEKKFVKCMNNNIYNNNDITKQTFIDKKYILIRGRMERKKKQSKRIFLYLRLSNGMYLTCVYEKKKKNTNENNKSIYSIDNMYTYIKNLKNESVIDIVGRIKLHGTLYKHNVPYIESLLNQRVIEIVVEQIDCISESFYNPPFIINDSDVHTNKIQMVIRGDNKIVDMEKNKNNEKDNVDTEEHAEKNNVDTEEHAEINNVDTEEHAEKNYVDTKEYAEKNYVDKTKNIPYNNLHPQQTSNNYEEEKKMNTNENLLKVQNFSLNYRNSINHLIFYIKSKVFQRFRDLLERDGYTEIFTSKFIKIKESEKNPSVDKHENNYEETEDNNLENTSSSDKNINVQLTGSEGGCRCYKLEGQNIVLSQSPQLFKQMLINSDFDKVYEINYCYRNEKFHSSRHLNEFMSLDIERVIYDNYYEIIIYMYNILKNMNTYINNNYFNELNILSSFYNNNNNNNYYTYRASQLCDNPIVISFSEAQDILDKYYRNNKNDILLLQKEENNIHINNKNTYIYNKKYNKYIKILNNEEKQNMKKKIMFESSEKDKLHNIYYYNKILKYYKINKQENKQKQKNLFMSSTHDMYKEYNEANIYNDTYYHFLNSFNKDEFYRKILLFFNNMYDKYDMEKKKLQENNMNVLKTQTQIDGSNIYPKVTYDGNNDNNNNNHDEHIKTLYDLVNIINKKKTNINNNMDNINNNNDDGNNNNDDGNNNNDDGNVFITEPLSYNNLKNKYILYDDFTNDELNYLYLFIKTNFHSDIFIIDQYPIFLRPYYTCSNMYDLRFSNSYDFIYKGMEIISGSQRIHNLPILLFKTLKENKQISLSTYLHKKDNFTILNYLNNLQKLINKKSTIYKYFNSFQYASKPHGGLALGMERYLITLLNLNNVKNVTLSE
ncbi:aspartate--tRNA ligase, putative [Plasmodium reichenowi]|uniref:aspartate--tRNA ligase n=1 Tax=Plasmodium reichenowi TaxID=5854 RepID=A0A151LR36_PLARE|nr:aspartate--tRNA ligase, putative [Plasmodium reichenowi]KYO01569.1 aspartate--tRNA ligase, putative [Plasmodium reichenowi]